VATDWPRFHKLRDPLVFELFRGIPSGGQIGTGEDIDQCLLDGEYRGRLQVFSWAGELPSLTTYDDHYIRALHRAMFGELFGWAGQFGLMIAVPAGSCR
jgi:hypothetical protein